MKTKLVERFYGALFDGYCFFKGYQLEPANDAQSILQHNLFVKQVFSDSGFYDSRETAEDLPDHGGISISAAIRHRRKIIGAVCAEHSAKRFCVESFYNLQFPTDTDRSSVLEVSRIGVHPQYRRMDNTISFSLLLYLLRYCRAHGFRYWLGCSPTWLLQGYRTFFKEVREIPRGDLLPIHYRFRRGRERFFSKNKDILVYLVDLEQFSIARIGREYIRYRQARKRRLSRRKSAP